MTKCGTTLKGMCFVHEKLIATTFFLITLRSHSDRTLITLY